MLVKEYRIPLPLTVEEYKIAQLYMIAKASKLETQGAGSGVEFLVNEPYVDGPGGQGQYTHKIYHVADHLPGWLKAILPRFVSGAVVDEEGWNAYPYTKTRYSCQSIEKFFIELETLYFDDNGYQENVFNLDEKDLKNRTVDVIDIVKDQLPKNDYKEEEDPTIYVSKKTNRGPLSRDWVEEYWEAMQKKDSNKRIMCAYKLAKVEFKYWGMQSKLEKFIHDFVLRKTMLKGHRQAWVWQDEWLDLTMDDIRRMEREIQEQLAQKMAEISGEGAKSEASITEKSSSLTSSRQSCDLDLIDKDKDEEIKNMSMELPRKSPSSLNETRKIISKLSDQASDEQLGANRLRKSSIRKNSKAELYSPGGTCIQNFDVQFASWRMESIANDDGSSSNEEFYDAEEILENETLSKWSSLECVSPDYGEPEATKEDELPGNDDSIFSSSFIHKTQIEHSRKNILSMMARGSVEASAPSSPTASPGHSTTCMTNFLIIVVHGGNILESGAEPLSSKKSDLTTFRVTFESIIRLHYPSLNGKIVFKLVPAPAICADALAVLSSLSPYSFQSSPSAIDGICHSYEAMPIGSLPLFAISSQEYQENVSKVIAAANQVHQEFLRSEEGLGFNGHVVLIGDSVGSILAYDALCRSQLNRSNCGSENSINDIGDITGSNSGANSRPKSVSPANLNLHKNPLISISDGSGGEECDDGVARGNSPIGGKSSGTPASNQPIPNQRKGKISKTRFHHSFGENEENLHLYLKILSVPNSRRRSSSSSDQSITQKFDFDVSDFFMFGSPLSLMLTFRKMLSLEEKNFSFNKPCCNQVYNLFHPTDPSVLRLEPLLSARFSHIPPINVPKYSKHPMVDEFANNLAECIRHYNHVFSDNNSTGNHNIPSSIRRPSETPTVSSNNENVMGCPLVQSLVHKWWGTKRLDYALYCPEGLTNFPVHSLPHLFHASYWESNDVILFILKQLVQSDPSAAFEGKEAIVFVPNQEKEKWVKKRTSMKLKNITANHRANDVIVKEGSDQIISARFMYGPLDVFTLTGEKVDIHMMKDSSGEWSYLSTETTDKTGRITYTIPQDKTLDFGIYPFKLIVRGDHSSIDFFLAVVPPRTECVVFSIDGSFTASVSVSGKDPKVRAGAVDVVRHWQDLGYLIIYITGRPDMQQHRVISWLAQHNFPFGLVSFADRLSTDALKHKADYLKHLQQETEIVIHAAYGSSKDIWVYETIGLKPEQIYVVGKVSKKQQSHAKVLNDGYAAHLAELLTPGGSRPAIGNARMVLPRGGFGMGAASGISFRTRQSAKKTSSFPLLADTNTSGLGSPIVTGNAGRTQSASQQEQGTFSNFFTYHRSGSNKSK